MLCGKNTIMEQPSRLPQAHYCDTQQALWLVPEALPHHLELSSELMR